MDEENGFEELSPGQEVKRDASGKFQTSRLTPERAKEIRRGRQRRARESVKENARRLLEEAGLNPEDAPTYLCEMAEIAVSRKANALSALRDFERLTREEGEVAGMQPPKPGQRCPLCNTWYNVFTQSALDKLVDYVVAMREERGEE